MTSPTSSDPVLQRLLEQAFAVNPELLVVRREVDAEAERVPQAGALPDPSISVSYQNDGFDRIALGQMETTWFSIMATQPLPWPGKRALRRGIARTSVEQSKLTLERAALSLEADVRRTYLELILVRDRLRLLTTQESLWKQAEAASRVRYEVGQGAQSDLLRAQLELSRQKQRRWALEAQERATLALLNHLRAEAMDEPVETVLRLEQLDDPILPSLDAAMADAEARSPELKQARTGVSAAGQQLELARKEQMPDFSVSAGVMPRGQLEPMWQVGVNVSVPVFARDKQKRAVTESAIREDVERRREESVRHLLMERVEERLIQIEALLETNRLYRDGLLVLSDATAHSALSQYAVGRAPFTSVLEAINGSLADRDQYLESIAQVHRLMIDLKALSLEAAPGLATGMSGASMGGGSTNNVRAPRAPAAGSAAPAAAPAAGGMRM